MDIEKLKVAELRAELSNRGLDTKGTKPILVARLREAQNNETPAAAVVAKTGGDGETGWKLCSLILFHNFNFPIIL